MPPVFTPSFTVNNTTLVAVRWAAFFGQVFTVLLSLFVLDLRLPLREVAATIALLPFLNGLALIVHRRRRLNENAASAYLAIDILQFALLLFFTGGFENPFSMLIVTPVAVAAAVLGFVRMTLLALLSIICITVISIWNYPLMWPDGELEIPPTYTLGAQIAIIFAVAFVASFVWRISQEFRNLQSAFMDTQMSLTRQRQLAALGAQAAAAAHELGSPLATIAIVARELHHEYGNDPEMKDDLNLLLQQSARCRAILEDLSAHPEREDDPLISQQPVATLLRDLAETHQSEKPGVTVTVTEPQESADLRLMATPELARSLGNVIQNAIQHATEKVEITVQPYQNKVRILVHDDGPGFAPAILARIGEPYLGARRQDQGNMGLGTFIASTLIENAGGQIRFRNHPKGGAEVSITLPCR